MRRDFRKKQEKDNKIITYSIAGVILCIAIVIALIMYGVSINNDAREGQLSSEQIASILDNETDSESASSSIGKSIEEEEKKQEENVIDTNTSETNASNIKENEDKTLDTKVNNNNAVVTTKSTPKTSNNTTQNEQVQSSTQTSAKPESKKELEFQKPIEGEIIKEFAKEQLIFSETLQEWVTHTGIDIKANETAVVNAAEAGTIKSIKNDPRYGLTIVIEHEDGFETLYANLLSSEFVKEGEKVEKGQAIGTVGKTAAFESADEAHLHFEILKDSMSVDPSIYLK